MADANQVMANFNNVLACGNTNLLGVNNNLSDVASATTSRLNLGLGTAAVQNIGTSGANVPLLNAVNTWAANQIVAASAAATGMGITSQNTSATGYAYFAATNDAVSLRTFLLGMFGSSYSGNIFSGHSLANSAALYTNANGGPIYIGTIGGNSMIFGTNNTDQLIFNGGSGITTPSQTDKGAGTINASSLWQSGVQAAGLGGNSFTGSQSATTAGSTVFTATTTASSAYGEFIAQNNSTGATQVIGYGTTNGSSLFGVSTNNLSAFLGNGTAATVLGTYSGSGNLTIGTNNAAQEVFTSGGGISCAGVSGGDKGVNSFNCGSIYVNNNQIGTAAFLNTGNVFQVGNNLSEGVPATMRSNLGLGPLSTMSSCTTGTVSLPGAGSAISTASCSIGGAPSRFDVILINTTSQCGYSVGDVVPLPGDDAANSHGFQVWASSTQIGGTEGSSGVHILNKSGGGTCNILAADWNVNGTGYR